MTGSRRRFRLLLSCLICVPLLGACGIHGLHLVPSPLFKYFEMKSGNITYVGSDGNVFIADQMGNSVRVTRDGQSGVNATVTYGWPTWSPNGKELLFLREVTGNQGASDASQLYVVNVETGKLRRVFSSAILQPFYFNWAPDSRRIAVLSSSNDGELLDLGVLSSASNDSYRPLDAGSPYYWVWSRNSDAIIAHDDFEGRYGGNLSFIPVNDPAKRTTIQPPLALFEAPEALAGDRAIVALQTSRGGSLFQRTGQIAIITPSGTTTPIVSSARIVFFALSPNRKEIAYLEPGLKAGSVSNVLRVAPLDAPATGYSLDKGLIICYFWAPDSREIAYFTTDMSKRPLDPVYAQGSNLPKVDLRVLDVRTRAS